MRLTVCIHNSSRVKVRFNVIPGHVIPGHVVPGHVVQGHVVLSTGSHPGVLMTHL